MNTVPPLGLKSGRPPPVVLAYPRVYQNIRCPTWNAAFANVIAKCYELIGNRPPPSAQCLRYYGLGGLGDNRRLYLAVFWADDATEPDFFIIGGRGDDAFDAPVPLPNKEDLHSGSYGGLIPISLL